jgi:Flp pilus assembly protein TadD
MSVKKKKQSAKQKVLMSQTSNLKSQNSRTSWILSMIGIGKANAGENRLGIVEYAFGIFVFMAALFTYLLTLTPDIGFHDCGDMVPAVVNLGVCHPPGYPFFCLLGKLFISLVPIGNIAYRMNFVSSLFASTTVMMVYFIVINIGQSIIPSSRISYIISGIVSAGMIAFATTFWEQAVIAEKYSLNVLFASLLLFILIKWQGTTRANSPLPYVFAITLGLAFTHHLQTIYIVPASIYFITIILWNKKQASPLRLMLTMLLCFIVPLLLYLYLPLRAMSYPPLNWGDPQTLPRFIDYITIQAYKHFIISSPATWLKNAWTHMTTFFPNQFTWWIVWLSIPGFIFLIKYCRAISLLLCLIVLTNIAAAVRYGISNIQDYYITSFMVFAILIGCGLLGIMKFGINRRLSPAIAIIFLALPIVSFSAHYSKCQYRNYYFPTDIARNLLTSLDQDSVILIKGDVNGFPVWYQRYVENKREDVALIDTPFLFQDWYIEHVRRNFPQLKSDVSPPASPGEELGYVRFRDILKKNVGQRGVYHYSDEPVPQGYMGVPYSFFVKIVSEGSDILAELKDGDIPLILRRNCPLDAKAKDMLRNYAGGYNNRGNNYLGIGKYSLAIYELNRALKIDDSIPMIYYNLGRCYSQNGQTKKAIDNFKHALTLNGRQTGIHKAIGGLYEKNNNPQQALEEYKREANIFPDDVETYLAIARISHELKMPNETISACEQLVRLAPNNVEFRKNLALLYYQNGRVQEAQIAFQQVLQLSPNDMGARQMLLRIAEAR